MTHKEDYSELITALVDGDLDEIETTKINRLLESEVELQYEYKVQSLIKDIVRGCEFKKTPIAVNRKIRNKLNPENKKNIFAFNFFPSLLNRPALAIGSAFTVMIAMVLLLFNPTPQTNATDFVLEQLGQDNMLVQAQANFHNIFAGKLKPQLTTEDAEQIKQFFRAEGVKYNTLIPRLDNYKLVGAVVSEDRGEKFAHHVYADDEGHLVYLFQVNESYIDENKILKLTNDLHLYLDNGNCYSYSNNGITTLMKKTGHNVFAVVANLPVEKLENKFCNI